MHRASMLLMLWWLASCVGASNDPGLGARLRVEGAQFVPEKMPRSGDGPRVASVHVPHNHILPGVRSERVTGALAANGNALLVGLRGETGHWVVVAGVPTLEEPDLPSYEANLSFSRDVEVGETLELELAAVDTQGRVGPLERVTLQAVAAEDEVQLVVRLRWDSDVDLDLHVITPENREIWAGDINSYKAPGPGMPAQDPSAWQSGGVLDFDSNAGCVIDGRREENVSWTSAPVAGEYTVRVASASLCEEASSHYEVQAWLNGRSLERASGIALPSDTREGAGRGAGSLAFRFRVP
ncbi:MAG: hypothetical protein QM778_24085 [Myxococcales bacterium]